MAKDPVYTISSTPAAATRLAATIPGALAALAAQLVHQLPDGPVPWKDHRPRRHRPPAPTHSTGRIDLLAIAIDELVGDLYTQLHRAAGG
jgi:hypothetical protein